MRCSSEHQGGPHAGVGRPMTMFAREKEHLFFHGLLISFFRDSCYCCCHKTPSSELSLSASCLCWMLFYAHVRWTGLSGKRHCLLESILCRWQLLQNSPLSRILLSAFLPCPSESLQAYTPAFGYIPPLFPLTSLPMRFFPSMIETCKALRSRTEPGSLVPRMEPMWAALSCPTAFHLEGLNPGGGFLM